MKVLENIKKLGKKWNIGTERKNDFKISNYKRIAKRIADGKRARLYDWWEINQVKNVSKDKTDHPCQMPLEVMKRIIGILPEDYLILDPFLGSGTTALAAKMLKRNFIGIELSEKYCKIAQQRLDDLDRQPSMF